MVPRVTCWLAAFLVVVAACLPGFAYREKNPKAASGGDQLRYIVILSRHGVRSPTASPEHYDKYSRASWPVWDVPPGYVTSHGFELMKLFGAWDRAFLAGEGLLTPAGCDDAAKVYIHTDSDQRTRESGRALAEGMFPACPPAIHTLAEGTPDPLFHPKHFLPPYPPPVAGADPPGASAIQENLTRRYHPQLAELDHILASCGPPSSRDPRTSIFDVSSAESPEKHGSRGELRGPLETAASLSENFLLEYTQGMPMSEVGWGCLTPKSLRSLMMLHTAAFNYEHRNPETARMEASNLLEHIRIAIEQAATGAPVEGAPDPPGTRVLFLVGHDTNLASVAGLLHLDWFADGRPDDTPPGSALVFELWRRPPSSASYVKVFYMSQTLQQMRSAASLAGAHTPQFVPLLLIGCSTPSGHLCTWPAFSQLAGNVIDYSDIVPLQ